MNERKYEEKGQLEVWAEGLVCMYAPIYQIIVS